MSVLSKRLPDSMAGLSDLFFNYEHPHYDAIREGDADNYDSEEAYDAYVLAQLELDAQDFLMTCGIAFPEERIIGDGEVFTYPTPAQLAADFLARL